MAIKRYDVVAITGTYIDDAGQERNRYLKCGAVFENTKGLTLKLDALPVSSNGWFQLYENKDYKGEAITPARQSSDSIDDDLAF